MHTSFLPAAVCCAALAAPSAHAALNLIPSTSPLSHASNLVANGSFEVGAPVMSAPVAWANPSIAGNTVPPGWIATGTTSTYATWGNTGVAGQGIRGSAAFPDGSNGLYFGNLFTGVNLTPTFQPSGRVTFPGTPVFTPTFGGSCTLTQVVNTHLSPAPSYLFSFWTSGEDAAVPGNAYAPGIMGLQVTNVLPGDPIQYLSIPSGASASNARVYTFSFVPLNPSLPVAIKFINWGHVNSIAGAPAPFSTELVLDDVIINAVPAPGALGLMGAGLLMRRRRRA